MTDPWILGAFILVTFPVWIVAIILLGGPALILYGISVGGPVGAFAFIVGTVWSMIIVTAGMDDPTSLHR